MRPIFTTRPKNLQLAHLTTVKPFIKDFDEVVVAHKEFVSQVHLNPGVRTILTRYDLDAPLNEMSLLFGMQHTPAGMNLNRMQILKEIGLRVISIAYADPNEYGCGYAGDSGLTPRGQDLIVDATESGMIVDLSHASNQTAIDALDFIEREQFQTHVMASHSGCNSVFPHPRNLQDDVLRGIAELHGYVGIPLITFLLGKEGSNPYVECVRHVRHAQILMGLGKVGIGSDCMHQDRTIGEAAGYFENMLKMLKPDPKLGARFPDRPERIIEQGSDLFGVLEDEIGYNRAVLSENFIAFLRRSLPVE
ncbi:MAG: membrane dipeptidase [bacterium]|nr:membrane dipeptidase [bacterium]